MKHFTFSCERVLEVWRYSWQTYVNIVVKAILHCAFIAHICYQIHVNFMTESLYPLFMIDRFAQNVHIHLHVVHIIG